MFANPKMSTKTVRAAVALGAVLGVLTLLQIRRTSNRNPNLTIQFGKQVDWSRFAYTQYVTDTNYLCNSLMLFEALQRLGSKADRLLMYPDDFSVAADDSSREAKLLRIARDKYGAKLRPIQVQSRNGGDGKSCLPVVGYNVMAILAVHFVSLRLIAIVVTWAESYTKLLAFNQTDYDRVLSLDSDSNVLQVGVESLNNIDSTYADPSLQAMDELFLLPACPVAMPRAYWLNPNDRVLSSQLVLIQPSNFEFDRIMAAISNASSNAYDMEIVNDLYRDSATVLPHRPYDLLTGEFRGKHHAAYLGNEIEEWDSYAILREAKFLHFSDWPVPKVCQSSSSPLYSVLI